VAEVAAASVAEAEVVQEYKEVDNFKETLEKAALKENQEDH
jgi:hypothetical protein